MLNEKIRKMAELMTYKDIDKWSVQAAKPTDEETIELKKQIDWKALEDMISSEIGTKITLKVEDKPGRYDSTRMAFESNENLADKAGIFSNAGLYEELRVASFGTSFMDDGNFVVSIHFAWNYSAKAGRGSNGCDIFRAWYDFKNKKWNKITRS